MQLTRRELLGRAAGGLLCAILASSGVRAAGIPAADDSVDSPDWVLTGLTDPVFRLFTPASGAFFARTADAFVRSDDGGATWRPISLAPATAILSVDPTDHTILFAAGPRGVYKSRDDAASWNLIFPYGPEDGANALALAVSPADHNLVYLAVTGQPGISSDFRFFRSRDDGATWQQLEEHHFSLCGWGVGILQAHPTDARRMFRAGACIAGRNFGESLDQSMDAGQTLTPAWRESAFDVTGYPSRLVGGTGADRERFYLAVNRDRRLGGSSVHRSDDDGVSWSVVLDYRGGGSGGLVLPDADPQAANLEINGLAYDPANPDRVYVGRRVYPRDGVPSDDGGVAASDDGGATWSDLGRQDMGGVTDMALGVDGRNLYAATAQGLWQLRLGSAT